MDNSMKKAVNLVLEQFAHMGANKDQLETERKMLEEDQEYLSYWHDEVTGK